jgi:hypothetical protein
VSERFRVLALSATPGSDKRKIQEVSICSFCVIALKCLFNRVGNSKPSHYSY